jgi:BON domain
VPFQDADPNPVELGRASAPHVSLGCPTDGRETSALQPYAWHRLCGAIAGTFKGVGQLSGFVGSQADIDKTVHVARGVAGVKSVKNDMRIK